MISFAANSPDHTYVDLVSALNMFFAHHNFMKESMHFGDNAFREENVCTNYEIFVVKKALVRKLVLWRSAPVGRIIRRRDVADSNEHKIDY